MRLAAASALALALACPASCRVHVQSRDGGDSGEAEEEPSARPARTPIGKGSRAAASGASTEGDEECSLPDGVVPTTPGLAFPRVSGGVEVTEARGMLTLAGDDRVLFQFDLDLANPGNEEVEAVVGYAWSARDTGRPDPAVPEVEILGEHRLISCEIPGPREAHQPSRAILRYARVTLPPGGSAGVKGALAARAERAEKPVTLFGYRDRFEHNWRNWDWPYTKAAAYAPIADRLKPFYASVSTIDAKLTIVQIRPEDGRDCVRGMSHEQNVDKLRMPGAYQWAFTSEERPSEVEVEYVPGLPLGEEKAVFEKLVAERGEDLRARIRLSDLHRFGGDAATRAGIIEDLLERWTEAEAKRQMLTGRNDVRGPAYVGLVRSLLAIGEEAEAAERAGIGAEMLSRTSSGERRAPSETDRLARRWLEGAAKK